MSHHVFKVTARGVCVCVVYVEFRRHPGQVGSLLPPDGSQGIELMFSGILVSAILN